METAVFESHYENYCRRIAELDLSAVKDTLGVEIDGEKAVIPFMGETYTVSGAGIEDAHGNRPQYSVCVILSKYVLLCPKAPVVNQQWATLKDFHKTSQFTNLNVFTSDAETPHYKPLFRAGWRGLLDAAMKIGRQKPGEFSANLRCFP